MGKKGNEAISNCGGEVVLVHNYLTCEFHVLFEKGNMEVLKNLNHVALIDFHAITILI